jgi:hypothetical protein
MSATLTTFLKALVGSFDILPSASPSDINANTSTLLVFSVPDMLDSDVVAFATDSSPLATVNTTLTTTLTSVQLSRSTLVVGSVNTGGNVVDLGVLQLTYFLDQQATRSLTGTLLPNTISLNTTLNLVSRSILKENGLQSAFVRWDGNVLEHEFSLIKYPGDLYSNSPFRYLHVLRTQQLLLQALQQGLRPLIGGLSTNQPDIPNIIAAAVQTLPVIQSTSYQIQNDPVAGTLNINLAVMLANEYSFNLLVVC